MSQAGANNNSAGPPPVGTVVKLTPDSGVAVLPDGSGNINLTGAPTGAAQSVNDSNFETFNAGASTMQFAYRYQGSATTAGATTSTIITFPLTVASTVNIEVQVAGIEGTPLGIGGEVRGTVFKGGAGTGTLLSTPDKVVRASVGLAGATFNVAVDGTGNNLLVTVTGVAAKTIEWYAIAWFVQKTFI